MNSNIVQLLVLAGIAIFLILRLRSVLGSRDGYENPPVQQGSAGSGPRRDFEVIEGGPDHDITDHVPENSPAADALARMKRVEPSFSVSEFLQGARGAYEMILMGFEKGELEDSRPYIADDVFEAFDEVIKMRQEKGLTIDAQFVGIRELSLVDATFDDENALAEISVKFTGELTSVVKDADGQVIEGSPTEVKRQRDVWTFARTMGSSDPSWQLVATGE